MEKEETLNLIRSAQKGDKAAGEQLVTQNSPLIKSVIRRYKNKGVDYDDLYQLGCVGFIKAVKNFSADYEVRFSTYAVPMVMGEIKRFLRDSSMVKVSRSLKENGWKVKKASDKLSQQFGREASLQEISDDIQVIIISACFIYEDVVRAVGDKNIEVIDINCFLCIA